MNYIPQGAMHRMRAGYADGAPVRNRSFEQQRTRSGNPNMPIFNSSSRQLLGAAGHMQPRGGMGYLGGSAAPPSVGYMPQLMGAMAPTKPAASFHRPPVNAPVGGELPVRGVMPQMVPPQDLGSRYVSYFGRNLPIRMRG